jgi:nicotinate-nucleotide adenylyltransferase
MGRCAAERGVVNVERRLGILGGSFNPPHVGHLMIASDTCAILGLEKVLFVPAANPPHKPAAADVSAAERLEMTRLAVRGDERFAVSSVEIDGGLTYSVETVAEIQRQWADYWLFFILGSDSLLQFGSWHRPREILELCALAVALRPGDDSHAVDQEAARWGREKVTVVPTTVVSVSSSEIRGRVRSGKPVRYLVPEPVERYITEHRLYGST